jgi:branched-chain amino acid aminotransferase
MRTVYMNGEWVPESEAKISIYSLDVMQGVACFEMTRSFSHQHFRLDEHIARLRESMKLLGITDPLPGKWAWHDVVRELTARNPMGIEDEYRLLLVASPGCAAMYRNIEGTITTPYAYASIFPLRYTVAGLSGLFDEGVKLVVSSVRQVPSLSVPARAKHRSRLHFHLAQQKAAPDWALMLTYDDKVAEVPGANICALMDDEHLICTTDEALPGISQRMVADLAEEEGLHVMWDELSVRDILNAQEVWLTATPFCCFWASHLEGRPIGSGMGLVPPMYEKIMDRWSERVGCDIRGQMSGWDNALRTSTAQH